MKKTLLTLMIMGFSIGANALDIPRASKYDDRMQNINYNPINVTEIRAKDGFLTTIIFSENETVTDIGVGFTGGWEIKDNTNKVYLRPKAVEVQGAEPMPPTAGEWDTNLFIATNKYSYVFDLKLVKNQKDNSAYVVKLNYPTEEQQKREAEARLRALNAQEKAQREAQKAEKEAVTKALDKFTIPKNWDYTMRVGKDSREIAPKFAYDDGVRTYIGFDTVNTIPSVFYYQGEQEMMSNTNVKKQGAYTVVVVHKTAQRFILRSGDQVVGIMNYGFGKNPSDQVNTTTNEVIREIKE
ncbi:P-type conjugative transfer protein VirB9 [Pasteurellaceae bacterium LFhippo2]|nr:P-type conjugative transfer protein VirB9 [Pasteurellaceae bacterium LFhippo2]